MQSWVDKLQTCAFSPVFRRFLLPDSLRRKGDLRAEFYTHYRKQAEEYDKEFVKKHDDALNTTLIFVGRVRY